MPLSKHDVDTQVQPVSFDVAALGSDLERDIPDVDFALLMGSARDGVVKSHSDLDLALFLLGEPSLSLYERVGSVASRHVGAAIRVDIGILNRAEPIYRFEALKGRLLFCRNTERWLNFFSVTCRLYEHQMADYERQHRYRLDRGVCS
jgi:hypothetical protein